VDERSNRLHAPLRAEDLHVSDGHKTEGVELRIYYDLNIFILSTDRINVSRNRRSSGGGVTFLR
jgi:hypothetical protein